jgi:tRNA modification GTPase
VSDTVVSQLTPPGTGAIATVEVRGPRAWELARQLFKPAGKPLPESPEANRFWFGTLGNDEVVLAACGVAVEVHCHGGRRVVRWVIEQFLSHGCVEERNPCPSGKGFELLQRAPTLRTAGIILDQLNGAFATEVRRILALLEADSVEARDPLYRLAELGNTVGRHLVEPWKVVVAGPPNVGKSSLVNALAGYQRSVVSAVAGTTRDAVSVRNAFDGWPVELIDTAGLRDAEGLEAEGIERARRVLIEADLVLWVMDASVDRPLFPSPDSERAANLPLFNWLLVVNKTDLSAHWDLSLAYNAMPVSASTGDGIPALIERAVFHLVRFPPPPGVAVPFTSRLADLVEAANAALLAGQLAEAIRLLRETLAEAQ